MDIRKKDRKGGEQLCPETVRTGAAAEKAGPAVSVRTAPAAGCRSQVRGKIPVSGITEYGKTKKKWADWLWHWKKQMTGDGAQTG